MLTLVYLGIPHTEQGLSRGRADKTLGMTTPLRRILSPRVPSPWRCRSFCASSLTEAWSAPKTLQNEENPQEMEENGSPRNLTESEEDPWEEERKWRMTPSIVSNAIGFRYGDPQKIWTQKIGLTESERSLGGISWNNKNRLEALKRYKALTGNKVALSGFEISASHDWLGASPRALLPEQYSGLVEVKCPFNSGKPGDADPWDKIPAFYMPRLQALMEIFDKEWVDLFLWFPKGSSLFRVNRDKEYWDVVFSALSDFWMNHVVPARQVLGSENCESRLQILKLRPFPRHSMFQTIFQKSEELAMNANLLVRDFEQQDEAGESGKIIGLEQGTEEEVAKTQS